MFTRRQQFPSVLSGHRTRNAGIEKFFDRIVQTTAEFMESGCLSQFRFEGIEMNFKRVELMCYWSPPFEALVN